MTLRSLRSHPVAVICYICEKFFASTVVLQQIKQLESDPEPFKVFLKYNYFVQR